MFRLFSPFSRTVVQSELDERKCRKEDLPCKSLLDQDYSERDRRKEVRVIYLFSRAELKANKIE